MNKILTLSLCLLFALAGCKKAADKTPASQQDAQQAAQRALMEQMNDPDFQAMQTIAKEALQSEDWEGAIAKLDEFAGKFEEDSRNMKAAKGMKFTFLLFARKIDEAKQLGESIPEVQEELKKGQDLYSESSINMLEASALMSVVKIDEAESKLDAVFGDANTTVDQKQRILLTKAMLALRAKGDSESFEKLTEEAIALDPESELSKQATVQLETVKNMIKESKQEQEKEVEQEVSEEQEEAIKEPAE